MFRRTRTFYQSTVKLVVLCYCIPYPLPGKDVISKLYYEELVFNNGQPNVRFFVVLPLPSKHT